MSKMSTMSIVIKALLGFAVVLVLAACGQANGGQASDAAKPDAATAMAPAQSSDAYVLYPDLPLWQDDNGKAKYIESLSLGDKISLLGQTKKLVQDKNERDYVYVRALSGKEGWVRPNLIAGNSRLGVVKAEGAGIYSEPRDVKMTSQSLSPRNLVAIDLQGASGGFVKVSAWDLAKSQLYSEVFVSENDISQADEDINAVILLTVAKSTKNPDAKKALLKSAQTKYGNSAFAADIEAELQAAEQDSGAGGVQ